MVRDLDAGRKSAGEPRQNEHLRAARLADAEGELLQVRDSEDVDRRPMDVEAREAPAGGRVQTEGPFRAGRGQLFFPAGTFGGFGAGAPGFAVSARMTARMFAMSSGVTAATSTPVSGRRSHASIRFSFTFSESRS